MTTLYFMRHAKTEMNLKGLWSGLTDCDTTEEGLRIFKENFEPYSTIKFDHFYCSPLKRTMQTLIAVIPKFPDNADITIDRRIIERDLGDWEGEPYNIIDDETTELYIQGKVEPPNGENYQEVQKRVEDFVNQLFTVYDNENILIVSHATIVRMVRDVFLPDMKKGPIKNSQLIIVTENDFAEYSRRNE